METSLQEKNGDAEKDCITDCENDINFAQETTNDDQDDVPCENC